MINSHKPLHFKSAQTTSVAMNEIDNPTSMRRTENRSVPFVKFLKQNKLIKYRICYALVGLLLGGCAEDGSSEQIDSQGNDWDIIIPSSKDHSGIGNTEGYPKGTPWVLPEGIELVDRPQKPFDPDLGLLYGSINTFYADIHFVNNLADTLTVKMPSGLVFIFKHEGQTQNGILTSTVNIKVPPTYTDVLIDTTTVYIGLGCLNLSKAFPWEENQQPDTQNYPIGKDMYTPSIITSDTNILHLLDILKDYPKLTLTQHYNPQEMFEEDYETPEWRVIYTLIQGALWKITDGPGVMRSEYQELLDALEPYK